MNFEIFPRGGRSQIPSSTKMLARLSQTGIIILNKACFDWLNSESVLLLFDREARRIAIRSCSPETLHAVTLQKPRRSMTRITAHAFFKWIGDPEFGVYVVMENAADRQLEIQLPEKSDA